MSLLVRGWAGQGTARLSVDVPAGAVARVTLRDPAALLDRVAGLAEPALWVRVGERDCGRLPAHERARAGLATLDGRLPRGAGLRVLDVLLLGRPPAGVLGVLGVGGEARLRREQEREAAARALAGRLGLGPVLETPVDELTAEQALLADLGRALLGEPRALVAAPDPALAQVVTTLLLAEASRTSLAGCVLLPWTLGRGAAADG